MKKINVMIVDDSPLTRVIIRRILEEDPKQRFHVIERATNGQHAVYSVKAHMGKIDVITMDIEMPIMNGLEAVKIIMKENPLPIIMFSSLSKPQALETIKAMEYGAYDFLPKPESKDDYENLKEDLYQKIESGYLEFNRENQSFQKTHKIMKRNEVIKGYDSTKVKNYEFKRRENVPLSNLILLGCSTGGPRALNIMINQIPQDMPAAVLIVQHMMKGPFMRTMIERLKTQAKVTIKMAEEGEVIKDGFVYVADNTVHLEVQKRGENYYIHYVDKPPVSLFKPSVDVLFESVAKIRPSVPVYTIVATGMGFDGANGFKQLKEMGATTIVESKETAVAYGMPNKAKETGAADYEKNIDHIIPLICNLIKGR